MKKWMSLYIRTLIMCRITIFPLMKWCVSLALVFLITCRFPDIFTPSSGDCTAPKTEQKPFQLKKRYFVLVPGDTALLAGTVACTVITSGVLTSVTSDSSYFRTITSADTTLRIHGKPKTVSPQAYQMGSSLDEIDLNTFMHYFTNNDSAVLQVYYSTHNNLYPIDEKNQKVMPSSIVVGDLDTIISSNNRWYSSPLIPCISQYLLLKVPFIGFTVAAKALAIIGNSFYTVNGYNYRDGIQLRSFYTVYYETIEHDILQQIQIKLEVLKSYFKDRGLVEQQIDIVTQKLSADGNVTIIKKHINHQRGPEGAPEYKDWQ